MWYYIAASFGACVGFMAFAWLSANRENREIQRLWTALEKIRNGNIANMKPASVALYQLFVKETASKALKGEMRECVNHTTANGGGNDNE